MKRIFVSLEPYYFDCYEEGGRKRRGKEDPGLLWCNQRQTDTKIVDIFLKSRQTDKKTVDIFLKSRQTDKKTVDIFFKSRQTDMKTVDI